MIYQYNITFIHRQGLSMWVKDVTMSTCLRVYIHTFIHTYYILSLRIYASFYNWVISQLFMFVSSLGLTCYVRSGGIKMIERVRHVIIVYCTSHLHQTFLFKKTIWGGHSVIWGADRLRGDTSFLTVVFKV